MHELPQEKEQLILQIRETHYKCREQLMELFFNPQSEPVLLEKLRTELALSLRSLDTYMRELYRKEFPDMPVDDSIYLLVKYLDWKAQYLGSKAGVGLFSPDEIVLLESESVEDKQKRKRLFRKTFPEAPRFVNHWHRVYELPDELNPSETVYCGPGDNHTFINWADLISWYAGVPLNVYEITTLTVNGVSHSGGTVENYGSNPLDDTDQDNRAALRISYSKSGEIQFFE